MILEACVSTISGLKAAQKYGIQRIEICKDLHLEGLTPTRCLHLVQTPNTWEK